MSRVLAVLCFVELFFLFTFFYTFLGDVFISLQVMWKMLERKPRYTFFPKLEITLRKDFHESFAPQWPTFPLKDPVWANCALQPLMTRLNLASTCQNIHTSSKMSLQYFAIWLDMWQSSLYIKIIIIVIIFVQDLVLRAFDIWHKLAISLLTSPFCRYWTFVTRTASMTMSSSLTGNVDTYM